MIHILELEEQKEPLEPLVLMGQQQLALVEVLAMVEIAHIHQRGQEEADGLVAQLHGIMIQAAAVQVLFMFLVHTFHLILI